MRAFLFFIMIPPISSAGGLVVVQMWPEEEVTATVVLATIGLTYVAMACQWRLAELIDRFDVPLCFLPVQPCLSCIVRTVFTSWALCCR